MESITLSASSKDISFDANKCILCQKQTHQKTVSTDNGRKRIREASVIHNDHVAKRIKLVEADNFCYHVSNECYKRYTMKSVLERISSINPVQDTSSCDQAQKDCRSSRSQAVRSPPISGTAGASSRDLNCIICAKKSCKQVYTKYRISESNRASSFLCATNYFQDAVFERTCDLQDPCSVFGADIYYHNECMIKYMYKYESRNKDIIPKCSAKRLAWNQIVPELEEGLKNGKGYELSAIRDYLNTIDSMCNFHNREVKVFLTNQFGGGIDFSYPDNLRKSMMVFSVSNTAANVFAERIRSVDSLQVCAALIRRSLDNYDFGLDDSFCDSHDLRHACSDMNIPDPILRLFGYLYNFNPDTYQCAAQSVMTDKYVASEQEDDGNDDENEEGILDGNLSTQRCRKMQSLFQVMYYLRHHGRKRTPMHIMNAEAVHSLGRGGKIVTSILNHEGLALSYTELRRYQHDMASFTAEHNQDRVALPSHFDPGQFTSGAIDNWDHEGAHVSAHDTVAVLFQNKPPTSVCKPKMSETLVVHGPQAFKETLPCQKLLEFHKPARHPDLPSSFNVESKVYTSEEAASARFKDTTWSLARLDVTKAEISVYPESQTMPSWSASNSVWSEESLSLKNLAFLPVLPHPITAHATVYTAMTNFMALNSQLSQPQIPLYCDEGVYCIVKEIHLLRPHEFRNLVPVIGTFHLLKTVLKCIGKYLGGSGADITWLQAGVFGPTVIQNSVLNGGHYNRSLEGMKYLAEAMQRLLYKEFFAEKGVQSYAEELSILKKLQSSVAQNDTSNSQKYMDEFGKAASPLIKDLNTFVHSHSSTNENFKFWTQFISMMEVVFDLLRADREGLWGLHLDAVQRALYLFAAFDSTNYLRWCSVYLEDMRHLPNTAPSVHEEFSKGNFSIKEKPGCFTAVAGDQKLEQSINLSSKCSDGVIGHAKQKQYVAQWDLIYHEMMAVKNVHREYAGMVDDTQESCSHHESSLSSTTKKERHIQAMMAFIEEKGSPLSPEAPATLHNFVTKEIMDKDIRHDMLNAYEKGKEKYLEFRHQRFEQKSTRLSDRIHRTNLKTMQSIRQKPQQTTKTVVREMIIMEKTVEIARDRGFTTEDLLKYDVASSPLLFNTDGSMTKPSKSDLLKELEANLKPDDYRYAHQKNSSFIIDVMANVRKVGVAGQSNFQDLVTHLVSLWKVYHQFGRCDYVFDMYSDSPSVKDSERMRRSEAVPIEHSCVEPGTPIPKQMKTFWSSSRNKLLLEKLIYRHLRSHDPKCWNYSTVVGQVSTDEEEWQCIRIQGGKITPLPHMQDSYEEADMRIPMHVLDSLKAGHTTCVVISNDTDVIVALLYHCPVFIQNGLEQLWVRAGVGDTTRYVPLHTLHRCLGHDLCSVLPALHSLTGSDITSKVGTKKAALKAEPVKFLKNFGTSECLSSAMIQNAEQYLVKVLKKGTSATNFCGLRVEIFHHSKCGSLYTLPSTSQGLLPHIQRSFYSTYTTLHAIESHLNPTSVEVLKPENFGFYLDQGNYMPATSWSTIPKEWTNFCSCTKCARTTCSCRMAGVKCSKFCLCKKATISLCRNPIA